MSARGLTVPLDRRDPLVTDDDANLIRDDVIVGVQDTPVNNATLETRTPRRSGGSPRVWRRARGRSEFD